MYTDFYGGYDNHRSHYEDAPFAKRACYTEEYYEPHQYATDYELPRFLPSRRYEMSYQMSRPPMNFRGRSRPPLLGRGSFRGGFSPMGSEEIYVPTPSNPLNRYVRGSIPRALALTRGRSEPLIPRGSLLRGVKLRGKPPRGMTRGKPTSLRGNLLKRAPARGKGLSRGGNRGKGFGHLQRSGDASGSTSKGMFYCQLCFKGFKTETAKDAHAADRHPQVLQSTGEFKCDECPKVFKLKSAFIQHKAAHDNKTVNPHVTSEAKYKCEHCDSKFARIYSIISHLKTAHGIIESNTIYCKICDESVETEQELAAHYKTLHQQKLLSDPLEEEFKRMASCTGPFPCIVCGKRFASNEHYKSHYFIAHEEAKNVPFRCLGCKRRFPTKGKLTKHIESIKADDLMSVHNAENFPFSCEHCGQLFKRKLVLLKHLVNMHNISVIERVCMICDAEMNNIESLRLHVKTHFD